jgi:hypothetical protein
MCRNLLCRVTSPVMVQLGGSKAARTCAPDSTDRRSPDHLLRSGAAPHGSLTPAAVPLSDAEFLFNEPGPPQSAHQDRLFIQNRFPLMASAMHHLGYPLVLH